MKRLVIGGIRVPYLLKNYIVNVRKMKTEKLSIYLNRTHSYFRNVYLRLKKYKHLSYIKYRAWRIDMNTDKTMGDKLRTLAAKADAIDEYYYKHCNENKIDRLTAHKNKKWYTKHKNNLKKELLLLNYNY